MRIKEIEFENFRNFKERGHIECSTDGKVTIIYGLNGEGKTTLHQLFQWVFYGEVHFNNTTSDILYNFEYAEEQKINASFEVFGRIDFSDRGNEYSVTRTVRYKKGLKDISRVNEVLEVTHLVEDDWKPMDKPQEVIDNLIPPGLSEYFFFDGEGMIADLKAKGRDSAKKLKQSLYTMFDLDVIDNAISHIGNIESKTTVLGTLYLSKGEIASSTEINAAKTKVSNAEGKVAELEEKTKEKTRKKKQLDKIISELSERIGSAKPDSYYVEQRKQLREQRDLFLKNVQDAQTDFGAEVLSTYPKLLMAKATETARQKIKQNFDVAKCPDGLEKKLVEYLSKEDTEFCICGRKLDGDARMHIKHLLQFFHPYSNDAAYSRFLREAETIKADYDREKLHDIIKRALDNSDLAGKCDKQVRDLDDDQKKDQSISEYITERQEAESEKEQIENDLDELKSKLDRAKLVLKRHMKDFDQLTNTSDAGKRAEHMIAIMQAVKATLEERLAYESRIYSEKLEECIQELMNEMLTSKRTVSVSDEFAVRIVDSFNDESKSEGQFAVVSFAYIGGIMKMLKDEMANNTKEYPLVLDGPFSKLDPDQRKNVIDCLPTFAPQVILFSKDPLNEYFPEGSIGRIWTIKSNEERNVAVVKEGYLWK